MRPVHPLSDSELGEHVANLDRDGYTIIRNQIAPEYLDSLRDIAQRAADDYIAAWRGGMKLSGVNIGDRYGTRKFDLNPNARACFLWGDAAIELLDHDTVHAICEPALGTYHFSDLVANTQRYNPGEQSEGIHRDFRPGSYRQWQAQGAVVLFFARRVHGGKRCDFGDTGYSSLQGWRRSLGRRIPTRITIATESRLSAIPVICWWSTRLACTALA